MSKDLSDQERVSQGQLMARIVIEVLGAPKEHIEDAIELLVKRIHKEEDCEVNSEETFEATEKGKLFSTFSEIDIWFKDLKTLEKFMFEYAPASVEISQPSEINITSNFFSGILNDFMAKLHDHAFKLKDVSGNAQALARNTDAVIRNFILFLIQEPKDTAEIAKTTGIPEKNMEAILEKLSEANIIKKDGEKWIKSG
ncbi:hypothetical protein ACFL0V_03285 [Nanoarchaeota archaeon]